MPVLYLGLALLAMGILLQAHLGRLEDYQLAAGQTTNLAAGAGSLAVEEVAAGGDPLVPGSARVRLQLETGGTPRSFDLGLHHSRLVDGLWLTVTGVSPAVRVSATEPDSEAPLLLQPFLVGAAPAETVELPLSAPSSDSSFVGVPSQNVTLAVQTLPAQAPGETRFRVLFFRGVNSRPSHSADLAGGDQVEFDQAVYHFSLNHQAAVQVRTGLAWLAAAAGLGLAALALLGLVLFPPLVFVCRLEETGDEPGCLVWLETPWSGRTAWDWLEDTLAGREVDR